LCDLQVFPARVDAFLGADKALEWPGIAVEILENRTDPFSSSQMVRLNPAPRAPSPLTLKVLEAGFWSDGWLNRKLAQLFAATFSTGGEISQAIGTWRPGRRQRNSPSIRHQNSTVLDPFRAYHLRKS
jgi:hypothetical protein